MVETFFNNLPGISALSQSDRIELLRVHFELNYLIKKLRNFMNFRNA